MGAPPSPLDRAGRLARERPGTGIAASRARPLASPGSAAPRSVVGRDGGEQAARRRQGQEGAADPASSAGLPGRPRRGGHPAHPPGPAVRLPGSRTARRPGASRGACTGQVRRTAGRRLHPGARERQRAPGTAQLPGTGGVRRAGADTRDRRARAGRRGPVRGDARRRAAPGDPATARRDRSETAAGRRRAGRRGPGDPARAAAPPGTRLLGQVPRAPVTCASAGRGTVIVVPDTRDLARVDEALRQFGSWHVTLTADLGPAERYRRWLTALRGAAPIVAGTRAAMFAPVRDLGLVVLWDDGDDLHAEPRAPYPHAREVLALRAHRAG